MKTIYVCYPMPITDDVIAYLKESVNEISNIEINPKFFENEDDDQTCFFEISDQNEKIVVDTIHSIDEFSCAFDIPKFQNNKWINFYE